MTRGERSWRDAGSEGTGLDQRTAPAEPTHEEDPLVEQAHEADSPPAGLHEDPLVEEAHEEDRVVERVDEVPAAAPAVPPPTRNRVPSWSGPMSTRASSPAGRRSRQSSWTSRDRRCTMPTPWSPT